MIDYWVDSDVLIDAKNFYYAFDRVPRFWEFLDCKVREGIISIPEMVFEEIIRIDDELAYWVKQRRETRLVTSPNSAVQLAYGRICEHVVRRYCSNAQPVPPQVQSFLDGGDAWLLAHAQALGGCVVTREAKVGIGAKTPKIPNIGDELNIKVKNLWQMLDELRPSF